MQSDPKDIKTDVKRTEFTYPVMESFYTIQGEGEYQGHAAYFIRLGGCDVGCHWCDVKESWPIDTHPVKSVATLLAEAVEHPGRLVVITGGEPLLGWQRSYPDLLSHPRMHRLREITFETNGTQELTEEFKTWLNEEWYDYDHAPFGREITFSVSPKLSGSGHIWSEAIKPKIVSDYQQVGHVYLKFVVATEADVTEALHATVEYRRAGFEGHVYLMPVGGVESVYALNNRRVAELAMKHGVRYSDRLQVPLFKNEWGT